MRPGEVAAPTPTAQDLADKQELRIVRARQLNRPVTYKGLNRFIGGYCYHRHDEEMVVYLTGDSGPVRPDEITFQEIPT